MTTPEVFERAVPPSDVAAAIGKARAAQDAWSRTPIEERLKPIAALRSCLGTEPRGWAELIDPPQERTLAESLAAEVGPLADACRWLCRHAKQTLRSQHHGGWFGSLQLQIDRKPLGVVLIIGASNYPLFLLGVQAIQALAAGNAVLLKPAPGAEPVTARLVEALIDGGVPAELCMLFESDAATAQTAIAAGVDHVVMTGSAKTGRAVASQAAEHLTDCTLECSGSDAVVVLPGADLDRVAACVSWGLMLNGGATCIGPRRLIAVDNAFDVLRDRLADRFVTAPPSRVPEAVTETVRRVVAEALDAGAEILSPAGFDRSALDQACDARALPPLVLMPADGAPDLAESDVFAPVMSLQRSSTAEDAIQLANASPYALGAAVFGPTAEAERVASRLRAGCVTVNDLIAPTADPRVPFGGTGESGYGVTRGAEGLLAMTRPQAIARRRGRWLPHLDEPTAAFDEVIVGMIQSQHATGLAARWQGMRRLITAAMQHNRLKKS